ncbi:CsbD family protein [Chromobacterium sinusclupearum]|uniref:CsbD family protein n=1 Tax=Chromobacterium sinusclupearum TaxID=2077146 RepID=A0A2K4MJN2_9NEIS|nr:MULTISPECIES: CsbD family protein [Chromobacterium]POA97293.1 CsbD family protein [Chromobacterium sinusclupearum]
MNKDQIKGKFKEITGSIKEATGKVIHNKNLEEKGTQEKNLGEAQSDMGKLKDELKK